MARIPILQSPTAQATGNATIKTPNLPAVTNAAIGEGLSNIGQAGFKMIEMKSKADDISNVTTATLSMNDADKQFLDYQRSPEGMNDDANWANKWSEISTKVIENTKSMALTPQARLQLENKLSNWSTNGAIRVQADVFKQSEARVMNSVQAAQDAGQYDLAEESINNAPLPDVVKDRLRNNLSNTKRSAASELLSQITTKANRDQTTLAYMQVGPAAKKLHDLGGISDEQYDLIMDSNRLDIENAQHMELVNDNPIEAINKLKDPNYRKDLSADARFQETRKARVILLEKQEQEQKAIVDKILTKEVDNIQQARAQYRWMDTSQRIDFEKIFVDPGPRTKEEAEDYYSKASALIDSYDESLDMGFKQRFNITGLIEGMKKYSPERASNLNTLLKKRIEDGKPIGFSVYRSQTQESMRDAFNKGIFGKFNDKEFNSEEAARQKMYKASAIVEEEFNKLPKDKQTRTAYEQILNAVIRSPAITSAAAAKYPTAASASASAAAASSMTGGTGGLGMAAMTDIKEEKPKSAKATTVTNRKEEEVPQPDNSPLKLPPEGEDPNKNMLLPDASEDWKSTARGDTSRILAEKEKLENPTKSK